MAPNLHPRTNPKEEFRLLLGFGLNFCENFRVLKIDRSISSMVEVLSDAGIVLTPTNVTGVFLHPLILSSNGVADVCIFRRCVARAMKFVDDALVRRFVSILPAEYVL